MIHIYYASETGNAEEAAFLLRDRHLELHIPCAISSVKSLTVEDLSTKSIALFVVSTAGDGEVPVTMRNIWRSLLKKQLSGNTLKDVKFAVFGLGDSTYEFYNAAARKLFARLRQLGGEALVPLGLGDDQTRLGYLGAMRSWTASLEQRLRELIDKGLISTDNSLRVALPSEMYTVSCDSQSERSSISALLCAREAQVVENQRMTSSDWVQDVRHLRFQLDGSDPMASSYEPGDILSMYYENSTDDVEAMLNVISNEGIHPDTLLSIQCLHPRDGRVENATTTLRTLFTSILDIGTRAKRSFFSLLQHAATDDEEKDKLRELSSAEGIDLYYDYCVRERRSYVDVLRDFRSLKIDLPLLLSAIPLIAPRQYSIASSRHYNPGTCELCVAVVSHRTPYGRTVAGLCTRYIQSLTPGNTIRYELVEGPLRRSKLASCSSSDHPMILVGPGTGIASMRAFLQHRVLAVAGREIFHEAYPPNLTYPPESMQAYKSQAGEERNGDDEDHANRQCWLFFGCRKSDKDFLFARDWAKLNQTNSGVSVSTAISQQQEQKVYVQHRIAAHGREVAQLLIQGGGVYVAGAARSMPKAVFNSLAQVLHKHGDMELTDAEKHLKAMQASGRYVVESWT